MLRRKAFLFQSTLPAQFHARTCGLNGATYGIASTRSGPFAASLCLLQRHSPSQSSAEGAHSSLPSEGCAAFLSRDARVGPDGAGMPAFLLELCYRSSFAREALRARIREPSIELALKELEDYTRLRRPSDENHPPSGSALPAPQCPQYSVAELTELLAADDSGRLELLLGHFERWYYAKRAPEKIKMFEPWTWFPKARQMRRRFVFHAGPTNSGKTHAALEALMAAKSGVYCAPLKALASQVYRRIDAKVPCDLLIGDERRFGGSAEHVSCTAEMAPVDLQVDVAVIDEIQMIGDRERGWAWSRALLGIPAKEIHLCGEERALEVVRRLLRQTREDYSLSVVRHSRLVGLGLGPALAEDYAAVENGDCIVAFGKNKIFEIRSEIEQSHPNAVVNVIYGSLPFSVRESESDAFNNGVRRYVEYQRSQRSQNNNSSSSNSWRGPPPPPHVLVTTDAIAYGLNMNIRRIVFSTMRKFDGKGMIDLPQSTVLQVGGRAGRFGMAFADEGGRGGGGGIVTTFSNGDLRRVEAAFASPLPMIPQAGLLPTADILTLFAEMRYGDHSSANGSGGDGSASSSPKRGNAIDRVSFGQLIADFIASMHAHYGGTNERHSPSGQQLFFPCDMSRSVLAMAKALDCIGAGAYSDLPKSAGGNESGSSEPMVAALPPLLPPSVPSVCDLPFAIKDRIIFCFCPLSDSQPESYAVLRSFAIDHCTVLANFAADARRKDADFYDRSNNNNTSPSSLEGSVSSSSEPLTAVRMVVDERLELILRDRPAASYRINVQKAEEGDSGSAADNSNLQQLYDDIATLEWIYRMAEVYGWLAWRLPLTFGGVGEAPPPPSAAADGTVPAGGSLGGNGTDRAQRVKDRCSAAIAERLALLPRSHIPPSVARRQLQQQQRGSGQHHGRGGHQRRPQERLQFAPRPLTDMGAAGGSEGARGHGHGSAQGDGNVRHGHSNDDGRRRHSSGGYQQHRQRHQNSHQQNMGGQGRGGGNGGRTYGSGQGQGQSHRQQHRGRQQWDDGDDIPFARGGAERNGRHRGGPPANRSAQPSGYDGGDF